MGRPQELVNRLYRPERIAAIDQHPRIAGKSRRIARHIHDTRHIARRQKCHLCCRPCPRRIEHDGIVSFKFFHPQRLACQIAGLGGDFQSRAGGADRGVD